MPKPTIVVLGVTGMLGSIILDSLVKGGNFTIIGTYRDRSQLPELKKSYPDVEFRELDSQDASLDQIATSIKGVEWVINAIGVIKPYIHDDNSEESERAIRINALFPYNLGKAAKASGSRVIQIATDCVYSGEKGNYIENDLHDALDVYGKTKSLGEAQLENMYHLRCSIIGPELKSHLSLMDWFLSQDKNTEVSGYTNHQWNGVTTLHFARIVEGIILKNVPLSPLQHVIPGNLISKSNLLKSFAKEFNREDIKINEVEAPKIIDRTLVTNNESLNREIWAAAGYSTPPTIEQMVAELAEYEFSNKGN